MILYFITEARFVRYKDNVYTLGSFTSEVWKRYLQSFQKVYVFARVEKVDTYNALDRFRSNIEGVEFVDLPYYVGLLGLIQKKRSIERVMMQYFREDVTYILRVPGNLGLIASRILSRRKIPYSVEVVGDPLQVFKSSKNLCKNVWGKIMSYYLKRIVYNASASLFVTKKQLQDIYPPRNDTFTTNASNVILRREDIEIDANKRFENKVINIVSVGMLSQMYKSPDVVLESISLLKNKGIQCQLIWIGDGKYREQMKGYAKKIGVGDNVNFIGMLPAGNAVRNYLKNADIFVLASRTEGLPRALIEAMAAGCYCVATDVGGIPELLDRRWLVSPNNSVSLANKILAPLQNYNLIKEQLIENMKVVREYENGELAIRRNKFYDAAKELVLKKKNTAQYNK